MGQFSLIRSVLTDQSYHSDLAKNVNKFHSNNHR